MGSNLLAFYDIMGIQSYIYQTRKLKDIVGASGLVDSSLKEVMYNAFDSDDAYHDSEIYTAGGNAILSFTDKEVWIEYNKKYSRGLLEKCPGLRFVTVCNQKTEDSIADRIKDLFRQAEMAKAIHGNNSFVYTLPPMAQNAADKMPISVIDFQKDSTIEYSAGAWAKNQAGGEIIKKNKGLEDFNAGENPYDVKKAERILAVVHIDGNQMGKQFNKLCESIKTIEELKNVSAEVDKAFKHAFNSIWDSEKESSIPIENRRKIYVSGDDVTYVCHGMYALDSVIRFLNELSTYCKGVPEFSLSASAGIAYVKPHFPFETAYKIAEKCCQAAKKKAREYAIGDNLGSFMSFEIVRGSLNSEFEEDLYGRPYCITGDTLENLDVKESYQYWLDKLKNNSGARSKWKAFRNAYILNNIPSIKLLMESCGIETPADEKELKAAMDALDLMDIEEVIL